MVKILFKSQKVKDGIITHAIVDEVEYNGIHIPNAVLNRPKYLEYFIDTYIDTIDIKIKGKIKNDARFKLKLELTDVIIKTRGD